MLQTLQTEDFLNPGRGNTAPRANRVYDLTSSPVDGVFEDRSGLGNDMGMWNGWYPSLNGSTDYVEIPHDSSYDIDGKRVKLSIRFRPTNIGTTQELVIKGDIISSGGWELLMGGYGASNGLYFGTVQGLVNSFHTQYRVGTAIENVWNTLELTIDNQVVTSAILNGGAYAVQQLVAPTGTYGDRNRSLKLGSYGTGWFFSGDLSSFSLRDLDTGSYLLKHNLQDAPSGTLTGLPAFDASGNGHHGEYVGCTGNNGEGMDAEVVGLGEYEDYMWFDGVDDNIEFSSDVSVSSGQTLEFDLFVNNPSTTIYHQLFTRDTGNRSFLRRNSIVMRRSFGTTLTMPLLVDIYQKVVTIKFANTGSSIEVYVDNALQGSFAGGATYVFNQIGDLFASGSQVFDGLLFNLKKNGTLIAEGNGVTSAAWGGGTVNGSPVTIADKRRTIPQMFLRDWNINTADYSADVWVPEDVSNPGFDAEGNPIDRPRGNLLNLTGVAGDYAEIADDASLDTVTTAATWAMTGNFWESDGTIGYIVSRYDASGDKRAWLFRSTGVNGDGKIRLVLSSDGTTIYSADISGFQNKKQTLVVRYNGTTVEAWIDGVSATVTTVSGSVPASLFTTDIGVRIGQDFDGANPGDQLIGQPLLYNIAATDASVQRLHRYLRRFI